MTPMPLLTGLDELLPRLRDIYRDLHAHPELSLQEHRTAGVAAGWLTEHGWDVTEGVGGTGVVGVLRNGEGPVVLVRADMDGLPLAEATGLAYASTDTAVGPDGNEVPVMHACGHDVHVTCMLGVTAMLAANTGAWRGTVVAVLQPAEEISAGAGAMLQDGFLDRFPRPDICLGQHVGPLPAGVVTTRPGTIMSAADSFRVRLFGKGGHGSAPETTVDPVVMAAAVVMRLQTVVAREVGASEPAVVTVGSLHAGTKENIIPDDAELKVNIRSFDPAVRRRVLDAVRRIVAAEADASGAPKAPEITPLNSFPLTVNDGEATERVTDALREHGCPVRILADPHAGSEDFGLFGTAAGCPSVFWHFGGNDPAGFEEADNEALERGVVPVGVASNHSPLFAPVVDPTIAEGVRIFLAAATPWLVPAGG
jgi:amidohydrolase